MRSAWLLVAALVLAGCASPFGGDESDDPFANNPYGDRDTQWQLARWEQPGLYARMPEPGTHGELRVTAGNARPGLALDNVSTPEHWGRVQLAEVAWTGPAQDANSSGRERFTLDATRTVRSILDERHDNATVALLFHRFAANVTNANATTVANWTDTLLASRVQAGTSPAGPGPDGQARNSTQLFLYTVPIDATINLTRTLATMDAAEDHNETVGLTVVQVTGAAWQVTLSVPHWTATGQLDGELVQLSVNARNEVALLVAGSQAYTEEALRERVRGLFSVLGLGEPETEGWDLESVGGLGGASA